MPLNSITRRTLRRKSEKVEYNSIQISAIMIWTAGAALILMLNSLIRQYGEPYHIAESANATKFLLTFAMLAVSAMATMAVLVLSSTTWPGAIISLPIAIVLVFSGLSGVAKIANTLAPETVGSGNILNFPFLEFVGFSFGNAFILWIAVIWAKIAGMEYSPNNHPITDVE